MAAFLSLVASSFKASGRMSPRHGDLRRLLLVAALAGSVNVCLSASFNVIDFGATGNDLSDDSEAIQSALNMARGATGTVDVTVPKGTYHLKQPLFVFSNTSLKLDSGATMVKDPSEYTVMLAGRHLNSDGTTCYGTSTCRHGGYSQLRNVTISGGVWDAGTDSRENNSVFYLLHGSNIVIKDTTVRHSTLHMVNLSAGSDLRVENVVFADAWDRQNPDDYITVEALHLDAATDEGEPGGYPVDGTPCRNVSVVGCTFTNVFAGVGTHHVVAGSIFNDLTVANCTFVKLKSYAVHAYGMTDCDVFDSYAEDCAGFMRSSSSECRVYGNQVQTMRESAFYDGGSRIAVSNNVVYGCGVAGTVAAHGIYAVGSSFQVVDNEIWDVTGCGIRADSGSSVKSDGNTIVRPSIHGFSFTGDSSLESVSDAVSLSGGSGFIVADGGIASISNSAVISPSSVGIQIDGIERGEIRDCTVGSAGSHGIVLNSGSSSSVFGNVISDSVGHGVIVVGGSAELGRNIISVPGGNGVTAERMARLAASGNTITGGQYGFCVKPDCSLSADGNTITGTSLSAVYAISAGAVTCACNVVTSPGNCGFYMDQTAGASIKGNSVNGSGWSGVWIRTSPACEVSGNTISDSAQEGIFCSASAQCAVSSNLVSGAAKSGILVDGTAAVDGSGVIAATAAVIDNTVSVAEGSTSADVNIGARTAGCTVSGNVCGRNGVYLSPSAVDVTYHPADARITSVDLTSADTATVNWEGLAGVSGYFVEYAASADFASCQRSEDLSAGSVACGLYGLSASGVWYVRVRTYHVLNGVRYESSADPAFAHKFTMSGNPDEVHYNVHFDANGGTGTMADQRGFVYGTPTALKLNQFTFPGYLFAGWSRNPAATAASYADGASLSRPSPSPQKGETITLYAVWTPDPTMYTVRFDGNGATSGQMADQRGFVPGKGGIALNLNQFARIGYDFVGWAKFPKSTTPLWTDGANLVTSTAAGDTLVLYAVWQLRAGASYTLSFNANGGTGSMAAKTDCIPGVASQLPRCTFTSTGFIFQGWAWTATAQEADYPDEGLFVGNAAAGSTVTLYAVWKLNASDTYAVHFDGNGATSGQMDDQVGFVPGKGGRTLNRNRFLNVGYEFLGWSKYPKATTPTWTDGAVLNTSTPVGSRLVLYAVWRLDESITYSVAFDANGGTGTMPVQPAFVYGRGRALSPNVFTRDGYVFKGWNRSLYAATATYTDGAMVCRPDPQIPVGGTMRLFAVWEMDPSCSTVHFDANGGTGEMADQLGFRPNETRPLAANAFARPGFVFAGWSLTPEPGTFLYDDGADFATGESVTLFAVWTVDPACFTVRFDANGGTGEMEDQPGFVPGKRRLTLDFNAFMRPGFRFLGWARFPQAETPLWADGEALAVSANTAPPGSTLTLYAVWGAAPDTFAIAYDANGGEGAMPMQQGLPYDETVALLPHAFVREGFDFVGWDETPEADTARYTEGDTVVCARPEDGVDRIIRLYAVWRARCGYALTLNKNDGSGQTYVLRLMPDELGQVPRLAAADGLNWARRGFTFLGWSAAQNSREIVLDDWGCVQDLADEGETVDLYAVWALDPGCYAIQYIRNDGAGTWRTVGFPYGEKTRMPSVANGLKWGRRGYAFKGWELTTADANDNTRAAAWKGDWAYVATPAKAGTMLPAYARWELKPGYYQIRFNKNDGSGKWRTLGFELDASTKLSTIAGLGWERPGYTFKGWASNKANAAAGKVWKADGEWIKNVAAEGRTLSIYAIWE